LEFSINDVAEELTKLLLVLVSEMEQIGQQSSSHGPQELFPFLVYFKHLQYFRLAFSEWGGIGGIVGIVRFRGFLDWWFNYRFCSCHGKKKGKNAIGKNNEWEGSANKEIHK